MAKNFKINIFCIIIATVTIGIYGFTSRFFSLLPLNNSEDSKEEIITTIVGAVVIPFGFFLPIYLLIGIPASYLMDYLVKKINPDSVLKSYLIKLIFTAVVAFLFSIAFVQQYDFEVFLLCLGAALLYLHILFLVKKEYKSDSVSPGENNAS